MRQIQVRKNGNSCLLRWSYQDENYSLTWGNWNNAEEKARLSYCAKLIYQDCLIGQFDTTLNKYNLWLQGITYSGSGGGVKPAEDRFPPLIEMLQQRIEGNYNSADVGLLGTLKAWGLPRRRMRVKPTAWIRLAQSVSKSCALQEQQCTFALPETKRSAYLAGELNP